jgi:hypothetical protein
MPELRRDAKIAHEVMFGEPYSTDISEDDYFCRARGYAQDTYPEQYHHYATVQLHHITPEQFLEEYIWAVYAAGFKAKIISNKWPAFMEAMSGTEDHPLRGLTVECWDAMTEVFANKGKFMACVFVAGELNDLGWDAFQKKYCTDADSLRELPRVNVIAYHIGRNIGLDMVKPDLHLIRLAYHYNKIKPESTKQWEVERDVIEMVEALADQYGERPGVADYCLWCYAVDFGTSHLEQGDDDDKEVVSQEEDGQEGNEGKAEIEGEASALPAA